MSSNRYFLYSWEFDLIPQPEKKFKQAYNSMVEKFLNGLESIEEIIFSRSYKMTVAGCCFGGKFK